MSENDAKTRRTLLAAAAALPGLALLAAGSGARAAGTVPQASAKYQTHPNGAAQCSKCNYFLPGANATAAGQCKVVAGSILPNGWCQLYAAKHG